MRHAHDQARPARRSSRGLGRLAVVLVLALTTLLAGCGLGTAGGFSPTYRLSGPLADVASLDGANIAVGSKNFTEQIILGKLTVILLQSAGADVSDLTNIPGSSSARQAQLNGQVDLAWEYTGTAWIAYLGETDPIPDERRQYEAVRDADVAHGLIWLEPAPLNNTYTFAVPEEKAAELDIAKLSQVKDVPKAEQSFCVESEFNNRSDGFRPMLATYGIEGVGGDAVKVLDTGAIYQATDSGLCTFGEVFTTDGRIKALDLRPLEDDKNFFPKYNAAPVVGVDLLNRYPQLRELLGPVATRLTNDVMLELNGQVDVEGREPVDVAADWLIREGLVSAD